MKRILIGVIFLFLLSSPVEAEDEFNTQIEAIYQVSASGKVSVTQKMSLTNKKADLYATHYSLALEGVKPEEINGQDGEGLLKIETTTEGQTTTINLTFNQQVVGKDKTLNFNLSYTTQDLAQKNGQVWEIRVPKLSPQTQANSYQLTVMVPLSFGPAASLRPTPFRQTEENGWQNFQFRKEHIVASGIMLVFGQFQVFDFKLQYHLENPTSSPAETEIALPPDGFFQQISFKEISPAPVQVRVDPDGNWLAKYQLKSKEKINILAQGQAKIFSEPQEKYPLIDPQNLTHNLSRQKFWPTDDPLIKAKAQSLKTPLAIYQFVTQTLNYDFQRAKEGGQRLGALTSLQQPDKAICMEFTDLFITVARSAGIPSREVNGFAYTTNPELKPLGLVTDVLHSWPEYFDPQRKIWVQIDPTWGKTTGGIDYFSKTDLSHFAFVFHGQDSQFPLAAGSYKAASGLGKNVEVSFGQYEEPSEEKVAVDFKLPRQIIWGRQNRGQIVVKNTSQLAIYQLEIKLNDEKNLLKPFSLFTEKIPVLPPFSYQEINFFLSPQRFFPQGKTEIIALLHEQKFTQEIQVGSWLWQLVLPGLIILVFLSAIIFLTSRLLFVKKKKG